MGVFDGEIYRVRVRYASGLEGTYYRDTGTEVRGLVDDAKAAGAPAADVRRLFYASFEDDTGLSYGDYWGDGEEEEDE